MPRKESPLQSDLLQGTLDMLVLKTLVLGPAHGYTIAHSIEQGSEEVLQIEHGSRAFDRSCRPVSTDHDRVEWQRLKLSRRHTGVQPRSRVPHNLLTDDSATEWKADVRGC